MLIDAPTSTEPLTAAKNVPRVIRGAPRWIVKRIARARAAHPSPHGAHTHTDLHESSSCG
jgi:hypothetical protein